MSQPEFEYLGPYRVEGILGRGGMGTVYKGSHARSGDSVAIKVIATGVANQSRFRRRFAAEIDTLKRLKHPHIVELVGYGEEQGLLFYSMEYVAGHSLHDHMRQHKTLPWEDVLQIGIETVSALKHAHDLGIIHRDIKPANLMLNDQGHIKLTDFGIAKLFGSTDMTAAGSVIGTADYMPPEQAEGKTVTTRSDLYSLGGVLYALLAGRAPFGGKSVPEVLYAVRYNTVPDLNVLVPNCPLELAELIKEMLEKDPLKRPPTALVIGNRMKAIQQGLRKLGGAAKSATAVQPAQPTEKIGKELTSLDLSDAADSEIRLTHPVVASTHEKPTQLAPQHAPDSANTNSFITDADVTSLVSSRLVPAGMNDRSQPAAANLKSPLSIDDPLTSGGPSRFTQVSENDVGTSVFGAETAVNVQRADWIHYLSIAGLVAAILGSLALGWWIYQPTSADQVYEQIVAAVDSGREDELVAVRPQIDDFLERFPEDQRRSEVQALADEEDLTKAIAKLQRESARRGDALSALEQAFLDCMTARERDVAEYQKELKAFLAVYGKLAGLSRTEQRLVALAEFTDRVQPAPKLTIPAAATQLEKLIRSAEKELSGLELQDYYRNLLVLYDGKPWAAEQLSRIRTRIEPDAAADGK